MNWAALRNEFAKSPESQGDCTIANSSESTIQILTTIIDTSVF